METYKSAVARLERIRSHVQPTPEAILERSSTSFDVEVAKQHLWNLLPEAYFKVLVSAEEVNSADPSHHWDTVSEQKEWANTVMKNTMKRMIDAGDVTPKEIASNLDGFLSSTLAIGQINPVASLKYHAHFGLYCKSLQILGTQKHKDDLLRACALEDIGALCLTEVGHGSNVAALETTATFDPQTEEFVINSPSESAVKTWAANVGLTANK
jgi:hypothetical protein